MQTAKVIQEPEYHSLKDFHAKHGCLPKNDSQLNEYQAQLRERFQRGVLSDTEFLALEALNFDFCTETWKIRLKQLEVYRRRGGDISFPSKQDQPVLYNWTRHQKRLFRAGKLPTHIFVALNDLMFYWGNIYSFRWEEKSCELANLRQQNDINALDPSKHKEMVYWISRQRARYKAGKLPDSKADRLLSIGLDLAPVRRDTWDTRYQQLADFLKSNPVGELGDIRDRSLANWASIQRRKKRSGKLSPERFKKLDDLGLDWAPVANRRTWEDNYIRLKDFKAETGHCRVPREYDQALNGFVHKQAYLLNNNGLSAEKRTLLIELGFEYNSSPKDVWNTNYALLVKFHDQFGHCEPARELEKYPEHAPLAKWVEYTRGRVSRGRLRTDDIRYKQLESIGFVFKLHDENWLEKFEELKQYVHDYGTWPKATKLAGDSPLGLWVGRQRKAYRNGQLSKVRKERLDSIRFEWDPPIGRRRETAIDHDQWTKTYEELKAFVEANQHCCPYIDADDDTRLREWIFEQQKLMGRSAGNAVKPYIERLDEIGFVWQKNEYNWYMRFYRVLDFISEHNRYPSAKCSEERSMANWVQTQRSKYRRGQLDKETMDLLAEYELIKIPEERE